jgi:hypothetical protein
MKGVAFVVVMEAITALLVGSIQNEQITFAANKGSAIGGTGGSGGTGGAGGGGQGGQGSSAPTPVVALSFRVCTFQGEQNTCHTPIDPDFCNCIGCNSIPCVGFSPSLCTTDNGVKLTCAFAVDRPNTLHFNLEDNQLVSYIQTLAKK